MNLRQKSGRQYSDMNFVENNVVVAVKAAKGISKSALIWALTNVVQPGDCVKLLVIIPTHSSGNKLWGFPRFHSDCANGYWRSMFGTLIDQKDYITGLCNQMMSRLQEIYDPAKVRVKMKVIYESKHGVVASEAKKAQTQWVVLDKRMKREAKSCMDQLECNVVVVKNSEPKFLRLNLIERIKMESEVMSVSKSFIDCPKDVLDEWDAIKVPNVTPSSSPESSTSPATFGRLSSSMSSQEMLTTPSFLSEAHWDSKVKGILPLSLRNYDIDESDSESDSDHRSSFSTSICSQRWMEDILSSADESSKYLKQGLQRSGSKARNSMFENFPRGYSELDKILEGGRKSTHHDNSKNVREMILLNKNAPPDPPPLCTICQHKAPSFGKAPRMFSYSELEQATSGFSEGNFLAEGGYGSVHRGVLLDGRVIAVKQHKLASTQGDREFCSEVQVLSCAQHRNVVMLIGYCVESRRRLLVYEYVCGGSLDSHLYGRGRNPLDWPARQKIAVGAARGLRYLHEECRVGCIVHRDMRPNNILLTHDFEPLVGDFGLARLQPDGDSSVETSIIGTFGYLAPEYAQSGQVTDKADIFSFGVVLVELITGRKAVDINRPKGEQCLTEWARPLLEENNVLKLVDPCLQNCYSDNEIQTMMHCANSCLQRDPSLRPRMSQVLRMLEGDIFLR